MATKQWQDKTYNQQKTLRLIQTLFQAESVVKKIGEESVKVWQVKGLELKKPIIRKNKTKKAEFEK